MPLKTLEDVGIMIIILKIILEEGYNNVKHFKMIFTELMLQ